MKHEKAARQPSRLTLCTCGAHWSSYYETCATKVGRSPRTGKFQKFGTAKMSRSEFEFALIYQVPIGVAHLLGSAQLRMGAIESARNVEGGYCYWEIMGPWAEELYGPKWEAMVDTD